MLLYKANSGRKNNGGGGKNNTPDSILKNVQPTTDYDDYVKNYFDRHKASLEQQLGRKLTEQDMQKLEKALRDLTTSQDTHIGIRFDIKDLNAILADGRFKSQFETHSSGGYLSTDTRADYEHMAMSYSKNLPPEQRPIYGMLFNYKNLSEVDASYGDGTQYGGVIAIMKPSVKRFATVTGGDSLDDRGRITPSPLLNPSRYSLNMGSFRAKSVIELTTILNKPLTLQHTASSYTETQIHGGHAKVSNIQHLVFPRGTSRNQIPVKELRSAGITWSMEGEDKVHK